MELPTSIWASPIAVKWGSEPSDLSHDEAVGAFGASLGLQAKFNHALIVGAKYAGHHFIDEIKIIEFTAASLSQCRGEALMSSKESLGRAKRESPDLS